jgi:hypothetical protein
LIIERNRGGNKSFRSPIPTIHPSFQTLDGQLTEKPTNGNIGLLPLLPIGKIIRAPSTRRKNPGRHQRSQNDTANGVSRRASRIPN